MERLHESLNKYRSYKVIVGHPGGRSRYKEQYAYFFRDGHFDYFKSSVYPDPKDHFERNPFLFHIRPKYSRKGLFIVGAHIKPSDAVNEIKALEDVYAYGSKHFKDKEAIIMGDLNADCSYMNNNELDRAFFNTSDFFHNVIPRSTDTTTKDSTDCAYDRIILTDDLFFSKESPKVFNFLKELNLTEDEALQISDHFPVEVTLYL